VAGGGDAKDKMLRTGRATVAHLSGRRHIITRHVFGLRAAFLRVRDYERAPAQRSAGAVHHGGVNGAGRATVRGGAWPPRPARNDHLAGSNETGAIIATPCIGRRDPIAQQQSARTRDAASTEQAVQQQDQERIRAQIAADTIALRRIYADDFLGIGPTGVVRNKAEVIADFTTHALTYQSITTAEVRVRVYGNTAVETGRSTMVGQDRGKDVPRENRFTRVWVMTDGRWQLVANHYSLMTTQ
jgi:ketosteroid isomerase-like protein